MGCVANMPPHIPSAVSSSITAGGRIKVECLCLQGMAVTRDTCSCCAWHVSVSWPFGFNYAALLTKNMIGHDMDVAHPVRIMPAAKMLVVWWSILLHQQLHPSNLRYSIVLYDLILFYVYVICLFLLLVDSSFLSLLASRLPRFLFNQYVQNSSSLDGKQLSSQYRHHSVCLQQAPSQTQCLASAIPLEVDRHNVWICLRMKKPLPPSPPTLRHTVSYSRLLRDWLFASHCAATTSVRTLHYVIMLVLTKRWKSSILVTIK